MSAWTLVVFTVVVAGATLWAMPRGGAGARRPRQAARRAGPDLGPPIDTLRFAPRSRRPADAEDRS